MVGSSLTRSDETSDNLRLAAIAASAIKLTFNLDHSLGAGHFGTGILIWLLRWLPKRHWAF